ncbi:hypothetical protein [Micromonospora sp. NPDC049102]|uniref:hypothetical protein n=1 Tax=Micromonospora sp. NPDC049102 TaxID=3364265 RepID=UPI0037236EDC
MGAAAAVVCIAVLATGCAESPDPRAGTGATTLSPQALRFKHYSYTPHETPETLAAADYVNVTAVGRVEGFREGVTYLAEPGGSPYPRVYMLVRLDQTFKAQADAVEQGRVYVEFDRGPVNAKDGRTPINSMSVFKREVPAGTRVALFLGDAPRISNTVLNRHLAPQVRTLSPHPQGPRVPAATGTGRSSRRVGPGSSRRIMRWGGLGAG